MAFFSIYRKILSFLLFLILQEISEWEEKADFTYLWANV